ncbi:MAG: FAD binding domain-containing protein [Treponema sp.]|jgi:CO/xanthine dehydrogenase FAD-binding subunit|nr:FAD binding domain-containing protein [Treponema sp.]
MADSRSTVLFPIGFQELFSAWKDHPDTIICAGGTELIRNQGRRVPIFPERIISLDKIEELYKISRTERFLEIGAMVKLNQILYLGKIVPEALTQTIECIAGPQLRNLATIGGNLCTPTRRHDCSAPLIALDSQFELRTAQSTRWISASQFSSLPGPPAIASHEILTRIRVPLEPWTFTWYRKFRCAGSNEPGGGVLFIIRNQKNILTSIRVVYSGKIILRDKNSETMLAGKHLPLDRRDTKVFVDYWKNYLSVFEGIEDSVFPTGNKSSTPELMKTQLLNFIESTLMRISD